MKLYYDLHIHSCLSPCGDIDMTPNNIVNMAMIKGLDVIAITDHNCGYNASAAIKAAEDLPLIVIPGMEIESSEDIHLVTLFPDVSSMEKMQNVVLPKLPPIKNKPDIFGEQIIMDSEDNIVSYEDRFLITACAMSVYEVVEEARKYGGVVIPAHIDKTSYSIVSNLGDIPQDLSFKYVEIKNKSIPEHIKKLGITDRYRVLHNSDAHYLWDISEKENYIECDAPDIEEILHNLSSAQR